MSTAAVGIPTIEFFKDSFHIKATIGTFIEAVFVEEISVYYTQTNQNVTWELEPETLNDLKVLAVIYYKDLK